LSPDAGFCGLYLIGTGDWSDLAEQWMVAS
jgi:hypothetical protein